MDKIAWEKIARQHVIYIEAFIFTHSSRFEDFRLAKFQMDWNKDRISSRGGLYTVKGKRRPGINIAMKRAIPLAGPNRVYEYKSFDGREDIGGFFSTNSEHQLLLHLTHEMAHAWEHFEASKYNIKRRQPHGKEFKAFYKILREKFLNPLLPSHAEMRNIAEQIKQEERAAMTFEYTKIPMTTKFKKAASR